ncbi:MAG: helix-turn-helix transcriptional regulator [Sedimentisphaerales bacterium]|jgi:DNA-binding Xre family transcriptional regulator
MIIKMRLKKLLQEHNLYKRGIMQVMANDLGLHRQTISKMFSDEIGTISTGTLSKICSWLIENDVPAKSLPAALFGRGRGKLWQEFAEKEKCNCFIGEYHEPREPEVLWKWLSRSDTTALGLFAQQLSTPQEDNATTPGLFFEYIPFHYPLQSYDVRQEPLAQDIQRSGKIFQKMLSDKNTSSILIGSQRVNYLLEHFVADLFKCTPFASAAQLRVPWFTVYRESDHMVPSCFGGKTRPGDGKECSVPGLHYINERGKWVAFPWHLHEQDGGVVIIVRDNEKDTMSMAVFGFGGLTTEAIARATVLQEEKFVEPQWETGSREIGVFICLVKYQVNHLPGEIEDTVTPTDYKIIPMKEKVLKQFLL